MTAVHHAGPLGSFGQAPFGDSNPDAGPSFWYQGDMILDPRSPYTYSPGINRCYGWPSATGVPIVDQVPSTASATNIASAAPVSGTPLALVSSSGSGITVGCTIQAVNGQQSGLLGIDVSAARTVTGVFTNGSPKITFSGVVMLGVQVGDQVTLTTSGTLPTPFALLTTYFVVAIGAGAMMLAATPGGPPIAATSAGSGTQTINIVATGTYYGGFIPYQPPVQFGQGGAGQGPIKFWNPAWALSRAVVVTSNADDTGGFYTINGFDPYGYPMSQKLTGVSSSTATTTKAFKYISSVVPSGTINSTTLTVGTADVFGLPLRTDSMGCLQLWFGATGSQLLLNGTTASLAFVAADITTPSQTTGDVRGTVFSGTASDGTKRYTIYWNPNAANMNSTVGLLGQTQA